jgi:hypothetical protein
VSHVTCLIFSPGFHQPEFDINSCFTEVCFTILFPFINLITLL